jgi:hypothetical protein
MLLKKRLKIFLGGLLGVKADGIIIGTSTGAQLASVVAKSPSAFSTHSSVRSFI